ncbi:MAG: DegV family protein [Asgard group archaeon]|nr:DegV family protein [Asgard group archaeon]
MAKIKIVSDSTCDLPEELIEKYNIGIVPTNIIFSENEVYQQYVNITNEEFYNRLTKVKDLPSTAIPAPKHFKDAYDKALEEADDVITFCVTSKLSGMFSNASIVAKQFFKDKVTVIDTQLATLQMGFVVLEAAKMAAKGETKEAILEYVSKILLPNARIIGVVPTLKYVQKGGRIGKAASLIGGLLRYKPFIGIENGEIGAYGKARGDKKAYKALLSLARKIKDKLLVKHILVLHSANLEKAKDLAKDFQKIDKKQNELTIMEVGPAIGVHLGPGALGFVWIGDFDKKWLGL